MIFSYIVSAYTLLLQRVRTLFWKKQCKSFGSSSVVYGPITVHAPRNLSVGNHVTINDGVIINAKAPVLIGDYARISYGTTIVTAGLETHHSYTERKHTKQSITIESGAWLAANCTILPGVTVGEGSVVAAGSVVTKDVPPFTVVAGVPATRVKSIQTA